MFNGLGLLLVTQLHLILATVVFKNFSGLVGTFSELTDFLSNSSVDEDPNQFRPSEEDVAVVRQDLLKLLPLELIDDIFDYARYWPSVSAFRGGPSASCAITNLVHDGQSRCYLVTPPIPGDSKLTVATEPTRHRRVREVRFRIRSHDQGWGGDANHRGTYNGSSTWFEAVILRPASELGHPSWYQNVLTGPTSLLGPDALQTLSSSSLQDNDDQPRRWHIQSNVTASGKFRDHVVTWRTTDEANPEEEQLYDRAKGRMGRGHELVRSLRAGDRLAIIAKALLPGWVNHVASASAEIFY
ncbi:hypothetical protein K435DRAFT_961545 [Dendrothele bispora CBS 962.96]|uniref:Uncharacterized protein n=1 Tax=Dendrothele bispora (strain CBS 962.96) TaxID=1314807 RepID=A0A4S8MQ56_DENBC|nr:hypothetical protein K435DRAFT_961545 [Dendrothele bispora CBS 962.96]